MNHECIKDLSMKISIEFKDQVSRFPFKRIFRKLDFDPGSGMGGGGGGTSKIQTYILCFHLVIVEQLWALNLYNICPIRVCSYFRQHLPVKGCQTGS